MKVAAVSWRPGAGIDPDVLIKEARRQAGRGTVLVRQLVWSRIGSQCPARQRPDGGV
jgi:hypothetical protein